jgi:hypothetical protein
MATCLTQARAGEDAKAAPRWSREKAWEWYVRQPWLVGFNYVPSTASNTTEWWQAETFDPATIDRELGWAAELGMNAVRVYLHDLVHRADGDRYLDRIDQVLELAAAHGIGMMPVLFDGVWHPRPRLGVQREPIPRVHNSMWVQGPGSEVLGDADRWPELRPYVDAVLARFGADSRVLAWDLFNEPDQMDAITLTSGSRDEKAAAATALLQTVFGWARESAPSQPLTAGLWEYGPDGRPVANAINAVMLDQSDIITFHCYEPRAALLAVIEALAVHGRPLVCTEWLARTAGSTVDLLPDFAEAGVGAINWGLVDGRTQTRFPWRSWTEPVEDDESWFHEVLHGDGTPYDQAEVEVFRAVTARHA